MSADADQKGKITLGLLASWGFGILFLMSSIAIFDPKTTGLGVASLLIAGLLLPPIRQFVHQKTGKSLSGGLRGVLVIVLLAVGGGASSEGLTTAGLENATASINSSAPSSQTAAIPASIGQKGIVVEDFAMEYGEFNTKKVVGTVRNNTAKEHTYVQVEFNLYDDSGSQVGSTIANINNLEPGGTWKFEAFVLEDRATVAKLKGVTSF